MIPLTRSIMREQLTLLNNVWPKWKLTSENFDRLVEGYGSALKDFDAEAVSGAVSMSLKFESRFPPPAKLREYAKEWEARNRPELGEMVRKQLSEQDGTCPICGNKPRWAELRATDYKTKLPSVIERRIMPCLKEDHPIGTGYTPLPENFIRWLPDPPNHGVTTR